MSHEQSVDEKIEFHSSVLRLKELYPSWQYNGVTKFLLQSENSPSYAAKNALRTKV